jgi:hypothetical protein
MALALLVGLAVAVVLAAIAGAGYLVEKNAAKRERDGSSPAK